MLLPDVNDPNEAHFLIRFAMDFTQLPGRKNKIENDAVMLHVAFNCNQWSRVNPQLFLSSSLEDVIGKIPNLPHYSYMKDLMDYVPEIKKMLDEKIKSVVGNYNKKQAFIGAVLCQQSGSIIEYDAVQFSNISLLLNHDDLFFILRINLTKKFPTDSPEYTLISPYSLLQKDDLLKYQVERCPYSPRWPPTQMITKALNEIFKTHVHTFRYMAKNRH